MPAECQPDRTTNARGRQARQRGVSAQSGEQLARSRVALFRRMRRVLLGPVGGRLPRANLTTLQEHLYRPDINRHVRTRTPLREASAVHYPFPAHYPPEFRRSQAFQPKALYRLTDVFVGPRSGLVWLPEGRVLQESVGSLNRVLGWGHTLNEPLLRVEPLSVSGSVVRSPSGMPYGDWVFDVLPGLVRAWEEDPEVSGLLTPNAPPFAVDALDLLGIHALPKRYPQRVSNLLLYPAEPGAGSIHPDDVALLQRTFSRLLPTGRPRRAIYISRRGTAKRTMVGEDELEARLADRGVEPVRSERLSFAQQVELFSSAELVISPHGSGLANILWCTTGCRVLEIHPAPELYFNDAMARLAVQLGHDYDYVTSSLGPAGRGVIPVSKVLAKL